MSLQSLHHAAKPQKELHPCVCIRCCNRPSAAHAMLDESTVWLATKQVRTQRGVPIHSQLRSHKLFSAHFEELAHLVDSATLYHTGQCI